MRRYAAATLALSLVLLCMGTAPAQLRQERLHGGGPEGEGLSVVDAVERALDHYPSVAASSAEREAAAAAAGETAAARWPALSLGAAATRYEEEMIVTPIHGFTPGTTPPFDETLIQGWVSLSYTVFDGGARAGRIRQARTLSDAADADLGATRQTLTARVVAVYLETLSRSGVLQAHERRIEALEAERERVRQLLEVGRAAEVELLRVEATLASAEADRVRVRTALDIARRELARLTGVPVVETAAERLMPVRYVGDDLAPRADLVGQALRANSDVERSRRQLAAASARVSIARGARWPAVDLVGTYIDRGSADGDFTAEWDVGLRLSVPLFTGGRINRAIEGAEARRRGADEGLRLTQIRVTGEVDRTVSAVEEAEARVMSLATAVARSEEVVRIEQLRLETRTGTQTDYLKAEADLLVARAELVQARHDELAARAELARVIGRLDVAWLSDNLEGIR